jgi:hypothetical protein
MTTGKTSVTLSLYSTGFFYDDGSGKVGNPTRPVYSAFTHVDPFFVPPAADATGPALVQTGTGQPPMIDKAMVFNIIKRSRANFYGLDGVADGFWNPGGTLANSGSVLPAGVPGMPPEVVGMHMFEGPLTPSVIAQVNAQPSPADAWRDWSYGRQIGPIALHASLYLAPPLTDLNGKTVPGYDRYLDPTILNRLIGLIDGQYRSASGGSRDTAGTTDQGIGGWDNSCYAGAGWGGVTSASRQTGPWKGESGRHFGGCLSFADQYAGIGFSILHMLANPAAAAAFRAKLEEKVDADLDGKLVTRAAMYERLLAGSGGNMGFPLKALTSNDNFDKFGGTAVQSMIWVGNTYAAQLALRQLLALYPSIDANKQPVDPAAMRAIVRQLMGLDDMVYMAPATPGWRIITRGGLAETYGSLASGYDGRYGGGIPAFAVQFALTSTYDTAMSAADKADLAGMARKTIAAFDYFLYPQHMISKAADGSVVDTYALGQEDVISWRVPYGPNAAGGWNLNLQTLAVDPGGTINSPQAWRSFFLNAGINGASTLITESTFYNETEAAWKSIAGVDPATIPKLPGEPGAPDYVWADVDSGAFAMAYQGERLFFNANYNRAQGSVNNYVRVHHITSLVDREATVLMPYNDATVQSDGNLTGDFNGCWVVRYGRYLVVLNRGTQPYQAKMPAGSGSATAMRANKQIALGSKSSVAAGDYEVFVLP